MPPADMQRLFGFAVEPTGKPSDPFFHRPQHLVPPLANIFEPALEIHTTNWDSLWIDMGGEG